MGHGSQQLNGVLLAKALCLFVQIGWKSRITHQTLQVIPERSRIASMQFKVGSLIRNSHPQQTHISRLEKPQRQHCQIEVRLNADFLKP